MTWFLWCIEEFRRHAVKIRRSVTLVTVFLNVKTACSPKCPSPTGLHGWHDPNFDLYLQVWTEILKCTCKCELWASFMYKTFFMWTVSSILFVVHKICNEPLRAKFSVSNTVPAHILGAVMSSGSKAWIKWTSCDFITFGVGLAFVDKDFVQRVA
jgi:hypothetical protein